MSMLLSGSVGITGPSPYRAYRLRFCSLRLVGTFGTCTLKTMIRILKSQALRSARYRYQWDSKKFGDKEIK